VKTQLAHVVFGNPPYYGRVELALLWIALASMALGLADVIRGLDAWLLLPVVTVGLLAGWWLAGLRLPGWLAGVTLSMFGLWLTFLRVGRLDREEAAVLRTLPALIREFWRWSRVGLDRPDLAPLQLALVDLWVSIGILLNRLQAWSVAVAGGEAAFDPVAVALVWTMAAWLVAAWAAWVTHSRARALQATIPAGALVAATLAYTGGSPLYLLSWLGATLLLMACVSHEARERRWEAAGTDYSLEPRLDIGITAVGLSLALVATAALTPPVSLRKIVEFAQRQVWERASEVGPVVESLGLEPVPGQALARELSAPGLPRRHLIGTGPELTQRVVMIVRTGDYSPDPAGTAPPRYYWRSVTYDRYTGRGWLTEGTQMEEYSAGEVVRVVGATVELPPQLRLIRQEVRAERNLGGLIYAAGELVTADHDFSVAWRSAAEGDAFLATIEARNYWADSLVPNLSDGQLQAASEKYPDWVKDLYLALPDDLPTRVTALARDLTATEPGPYHRARAIESYLRTFPYTLDLPAPPPGRDVADYFLFDLKKGYCDYYATAMVVLARAAGLPARLVVGYASGRYDPGSSQYIVTEADAHSWVEVYFPEIGWVEFEPTGGRPPFERQDAGPYTTGQDFGTEIQPGTGFARIRGAGLQWWSVLVGTVSLLALGWLAWLLADGLWLRRMAPAAAVSAIFRRLHHSSRRLAVPARAASTPYEFAAVLAGRLTELAQGKGRRARVSPAIEEILRLTDLYVQSQYSLRPPEFADQAQAISIWRRLRARLWRVWIGQFLTHRGARGVR